MKRKQRQKVDLDRRGYIALIRIAEAIGSPIDENNRGLSETLGYVLNVYTDAIVEHINEKQVISFRETTGPELKGIDMEGARNSLGF